MMQLMSSPVGTKGNKNDTQDIRKYLLTPVSKSKRPNRWDICIDTPFLNCEQIYPIQQSKVRKLIDGLKDDDNVLRIIVFGSSVESRCHIGSDVDLYVETQTEKKVSPGCTDILYDLWTNYTVDSRILEEINRKGILVYKR